MSICVPLEWHRPGEFEWTWDISDGRLWSNCNEKLTLRRSKQLRIHLRWLGNSNYHDALYEDSSKGFAFSKSARVVIVISRSPVPKCPIDFTLRVKPSSNWIEAGSTLT